MENDMVTSKYCKAARNYEKEKKFFEMAKIYRSRPYYEFKIECDLVGYSIPKYRNPFTWHHLLEKLKIRASTFDGVSCVFLILSFSSITSIVFILTKDVWLSTLTFTSLFYIFSKYYIFVVDIIYLDESKRRYMESLKE